MRQILRCSPCALSQTLLTVMGLWLAIPAYSANVTLKANDGVGTSSFAGALNWNSNAAPSAGNAYFTTNFTLRIPADTTSRTFAGDSLTLDAGGRLLGKTTGTSQTITVNNFILNGGSFEQATVNSDNVILTWAGNIFVNAPSGIGALGGTGNGSSAFEILNITANISGAAALQVGGPGLNGGQDSGVVRLSAANPYSGNISVGNAVIASTVNRLLQLNNLNAVSNATLTLSSPVADPVSFVAAVNTGPFNVGALAGATSQKLTDTAGAPVTLSVGGNHSSSAYSGVLSGVGSLIKTGSGTLTLAGNNQHTGGTVVSGGTLQVAWPAGAYSGSGTVVVMSPSALTPQTVTGGGSLFSGKWIVASGWLRGTNDVFGTNNLVVDSQFPLHPSAGNPPLAGAAIFEPQYDLNSAGRLTLTNGGKMILHQNCAYTSVVIEGTALSAGTHSYQDLAASFPNSFPSGGAGYITVQPYGSLPPPPSQAPQFLTQPLSQTNFAGMTVQFSASVYGNPAPSLQWQSGAVGSGVYTNLSNGSQFGGVTATALIVTGLTLANAGDYVLVASNTSGVVTSAPARLSVLAGPVVITNSTGLSLAMLANGVYTIASTMPAWTFKGDLGQLPFNLVKVSGTDNLGGYSEFRFDYEASVTHAASIRVYTNQPAILFTDTSLAATPNDLDFPYLTAYPTNLYHVSYSGEFAPHTFSGLIDESPWVFFDTNFNTFILSAGTNYVIAGNAQNGDGSISCGINSTVTQLPAGFTHRTILTIQPGINNALDTWGDVLTGLSGKVRPANDAAVELDKLGYWTDNGATYYYNYNGGLGYIGTLLAVRDEFAAKGVPLGYLQLDSWWYPKGVANTWEGDAFNDRGGVNLYQADATLFPNGLANFQQQLGLPLFTHCRWIDSASPYASQYAMSRNVIVDRSYWTNRMAYLKAAGVVTFEQDWLSEKAVPAMNLNDPPAFMDYMAAAAASNGMNLQFCMELPRHYLQSSLYNNLLTLRVSIDRFERGKWNAFLYCSRLAGAVGAWPWSDVFPSSESRNLLLCTLSAGPVGVGDGLGTVNTNNLLKAVRPDGVIVKPDAPIVPLDQNYLDDARGLNLPMVAGTHVAHGDQRALYLYSYARNSSSTNTSFTPGKLGLSGSVYVFNYFSQTGAVVNASSPFSFSTTTASNTGGGIFHVVVPVGPSGIALLGDTNKFVTLGKKRVSSLADKGIIKATVQFAAGETNVTMVGYAPSAPYALALSGSAGPVTYDSAKQLFSVRISPGASGLMNLALSLTPIPALEVKRLGSNIEISWPVDPMGFDLETTAAGLPSWVPATNPITTVGDKKAITVVPSADRALFRLKQ